MDQLFVIRHCYLIPLLPLAGAILSGFFGAHWLKGKSHWPIFLGVGASAALSLTLLVQMLNLWNAGAGNLQASWQGYTWISAGSFQVTAGFLIDPLTAVMLTVVTGIGLIIILFAAAYMKGESGYFRFFAYLGLFIFAMTVLVMADNFVMLYLGWEGVGVCSYLLIGFYYERPAAREAAKKAFLVNRVGDMGFSLGIMLIFLAFGTVSFFDHGHGALEWSALKSLSGFQHQALFAIPLLLMLGAFGKSAQFPLHVWLPDAMEGPTPVSALIHAATMVTAGVYMIARCGTLFVGNPSATMIVTVIGAFTAMFAATIAVRQFDLKKVFAYSTISQLGFMFVGVGVLAPAAGVFHLVTHAFFKALLFLTCGVVMHATGGELDMRKMSGLRHVLPKTRWLMLIGCAALAGFPFLSGFFSKDQIVGAAWWQSRMLGLWMLLAAFLTAFYSFRLYFRVFHGPLVFPQASGHGHDAHGEQPHHNHEPAGMILPLVLLAIGAIFAGYLGWPDRAFGLDVFLGQSASLRSSYHLAAASRDPRYLSPHGFGQPEFETDPETMERTHGVETDLMIVSGLVSLLGIYLAYLLYQRDRAKAEQLARRFAPAVNVLDHKYWIDEIYQFGVVEPLRALGKIFFAIDQYIVDGVVWVISFIPQLSGFALKLTTERGYLQGYAATMLLGIAIILMVIFL